MTPELRKEASELQLHKRGIRINVQLHVIEADDEVSLRTPQELQQRLLALWAVCFASLDVKPEHLRHYLQEHQLWEFLSNAERGFLAQDLAAGSPSAKGEDAIEAAQNSTIEAECAANAKHAFTFLCWCAGLLGKIDLSAKSIDINPALAHFPNISKELAHTERTSALQLPIKMRRKDQIMDWNDLLYRLHWAVRHATISGKPSPGNVDSAMVSEWHKAVNWICRYDDEDDWDLVSTETTA